MQRFLTLVSDDEGSPLRGCAIEDVVARGVRLRRADDESRSESYADILERRGLNELTVDGDSSPSRVEIGVLTSYEAAAAGVDACAERLGGLDVLVNNAGIGGPASAGAPPDKRARAMVEVNLFGAWNVTAAAGLSLDCVSSD